MVIILEYYSPAFAGTVCISFILLKIIALQLGMYVDIWHGFYFLNIILILVTDP